MNARAILVALAAMSLAAAAACESAVNLNVAYRETGLADAGDDADAGPPPGNELEACPCDESAGLGCCVTSNGPSFCTANEAACNAEKGVYMKCLRQNPLHESVCCWHGSGPGALTAYAAFCDGGVSACLESSDCAGGQKCTTTKCNEVVVGACGDVAPACP
jgi:hypothetical protein